MINSLYQNCISVESISDENDMIKSKRINFNNITNIELKILFEEELVLAKNKKRLYKAIYSLHECDSYKSLLKNEDLQDTIDSIKFAITKITTIINYENQNQNQNHIVKQNELNSVLLNNAKISNF